MNRIQPVRGLAVVLVLTALCFYTMPAAARTISAIGGSPVNGNEAGAFLSSGPIVYNPTTINRNWAIPLVFDFSGGRDVRVRGKITTSGTLSCQAFVTSPSGTTTVSNIAQFPQNNTWTSILLTLPSVSAGAAGAVVCFMSGNSTANLLGIDYPP